MQTQPAWPLGACPLMGRQTQSKQFTQSDSDRAAGAPGCREGCGSALGLGFWQWPLQWGTTSGFTTSHHCHRCPHPACHRPPTALRISLLKPSSRRRSSQQKRTRGQRKEIVVLGGRGSRRKPRTWISEEGLSSTCLKPQFATHHTCFI